MAVPPPTARPAADTRRAELAAFLRSRRERIPPEDVGLTKGGRRRTPGLRREEVAQLSGVGVTWYTWLEQGRPINVSAHVLTAVARTLRLDRAERRHLHRLAGLGDDEPAPDERNDVDPVLRAVLDDHAELPAAVGNHRCDVLAWNEPYARLFPQLVAAPPEHRNTVWELFTRPACCNHFPDWEKECELVVGTLRAAYGSHLGESAWTGFLQRLSTASPEFARAWNTHRVNTPTPRVKLFRHNAVGVLRMRAIGGELPAMPGLKLVVYVPDDDASRAALTRLREPDCPPHSTHVH